MSQSGSDGRLACRASVRTRLSVPAASLGSLPLVREVAASAACRTVIPGSVSAWRLAAPLSAAAAATGVTL